MVKVGQTRHLRRRLRGRLHTSRCRVPGIEFRHEAQHAWPYQVFSFIFLFHFFIPSHILSFVYSIHSFFMSRNIVLVTGGTGFIGSHTCVELLNCEKYRVLVVDDLVNSNRESYERVLHLTKKKEGQDLIFAEVDLKNYETVNSLFQKYNGEIDSVIHFAGLKAVGESVEKPLEYYENNVSGTLHLLRAMRDSNVKKLIFSSSATVYGDPDSVPIKETASLRTTNPYGRTKHMIEDIIRDFTKTDKDFSAAILRYFNPVGAHESGLLGEDPKGIPNNLLPMIMRVATGKSPFVSVFGSDWPTIDGTGVRDFIHVVDLAKGHLSALQHLDKVGFLLYFLKLIH
jgi:UDP-glucose 4-epimerase